MLGIVYIVYHDITPVNWGAIMFFSERSNIENDFLIGIKQIWKNFLYLQ